MREQGNLLLAILLSLLILLGFQYFYEVPNAKKEIENKQYEEKIENSFNENNSNILEDETESYLSINEALEKNKRVKIEAPRLIGSISLQGLKIDDLTLKDYKESMDKNSNSVTLFKPSQTKGAYFSNFGWIKSSSNQLIELPNDQTIWDSDNNILDDKSSIKFNWTNNQNINFQQEISVDENYMFVVKQSVTNNSAENISLNPVAKISRTDTPETLGFFILFEGLLGVVNDVLEEINYDELRKKGPKEFTSQGGWFGITDKFWLATIIPEPSSNVKARYQYYKKNNKEKYQVDYIGSKIEVSPGQTTTITNKLFAGAKEVKLLDKYEKQYNISRFDLAIDFGWYYFLTKPFLYVLIFFKNLFGNFGLSILFVTLLIKLAFYPLANKSYIAMQRMKNMQPEILRVRETHKADKAKMNQEMMALYKREKINPAAGCLPMVIQIPVFFALYKVLFVSLAMRHAPFYLWVQDLSAADPTSILNLFGLIPWDPNLYIPKFLNIGLWPIIMGLSMYIQQKLNPQPTDPIQAKIFTFLPIFFTFILAPFPAGLVIYWAFNNILSMGQQLLIKKRLEKKNK